MNMECSWGKVLAAWADLYPRSMEYKGVSVDQTPLVSVEWYAYPYEMSMDHERGDVGFAYPAWHPGMSMDHERGDVGFAYPARHPGMSMGHKRGEVGFAYPAWHPGLTFTREAWSTRECLLIRLLW